MKLKAIGILCCITSLCGTIGLPKEHAHIIHKMNFAVEELQELAARQDISLEMLHAGKKLIQHAIEKPWRQAEGKFWFYATNEQDELKRAQKEAYAITHEVTPADIVEFANHYDELVGVCTTRIVGAKSFMQAYQYFEQILESYSCSTL